VSEELLLLVHGVTLAQIHDVLVRVVHPIVHWNPRLAIRLTARLRMK
jgi:hypothetical protein